MKKTCECGHTFEYKEADIKFSHRVMCGDATKDEDVEKLMEGGWHKCASRIRHTM